MMMMIMIGGGGDGSGEDGDATDLIRSPPFTNQPHWSVNQLYCLNQQQSKWTMNDKEEDNDGH